MKTSLCLSLSFILLTTLGSASLQGADKPKDASKPPSAERQAEMMEMWTKLNAKGEPHAEFQQSVGTWKAEETHFMGPESFSGEGKTTFRTILDGRYLVQEYKSESPMGSFEGFGITAYDNLRKQYVMAWMDDMSTGISLSYGTKKGKTTTYRGKQKMPDGSFMHHRMVIREVSPDKVILTMHGRPAGQKEFQKRMRIAYTRVK